MKNDSELKRKLVSLAIAAFVVTIGVFKNEIILNKQYFSEVNNVLAMESKNTYSIEDDLNNFVDNNKDVFNFYTNMFGISLDDLKQAIINDNDGLRLNYNDLGNTNNYYDSLDMNLIEYLFNLRKTNSKLFNQEYVNGNSYSKEYIYGLISYFSNIYGNVDSKVLSSIAYIESGNLRSKYMMSVNNIYGGMSSKGLLKYQNIEFGVLSYVKMMSKGYYGKGLNTVEKIAKKYNPGSQTWVSNIKSTMNKFNDMKEVNDINTLINLK